MDNARVLITGGAGFIGSNFIRYILKHQPTWKIVNLDKLTYAGNLENLKDIKEDKRYRFIKGDIADSSLIDKLFNEERFNMVVNFAAESHVDRSILDSSAFIKTNIDGVRVLLDACRKHWLDGDFLLKDEFSNARFIQISTDEVYGTLGKDGYFTEETPLAPNSPYAASKASADLLVRAYHRTYKLPVIITRSSNNYGPYQFPEKFIPLMIYNALNNKKLPVYGDGKNIRDWIHVVDNCRAIEKVIQSGRIGEVYNIGGQNERQNIDIVHLILEKLNRPKSLIAFVKDRPGHDFRYALNSDKLCNELNFQYQYHFEQGLQETIEWYKDNMDWVNNVITGEYKEYYRMNYGEDF